MANYSVATDGMCEHIFSAADEYEAEALVGEFAYYHKLRSSAVTCAKADDNARPMADEFMNMFRNDAQTPAERARKKALTK